MSYNLSIEIFPPEQAPALAHVVAGLQGRGVVLETLMWTALRGSSEARIWLILETDDLRSLTAHFKTNPGIRRIIYHPLPGLEIEL